MSFSSPQTLLKTVFLNTPSVDTITTRFLMLFIIVMSIPVFSLILFTQNILKSQSEQAITSQIKQTHQVIHLQITLLSQQVEEELHILQLSRPDLKPESLKGLCPQGGDTLCVLLNDVTAPLDNQTVSIQGPTGSPQSTISRTAFEHLHSGFRSLLTPNTPLKNTDGLRPINMPVNMIVLSVGGQQQLYVVSRVQIGNRILILGKPLTQAWLNQVYQLNNTLSSVSILTTIQPNVELIQAPAGITLVAKSPELSLPSPALINSMRQPTFNAMRSDAIEIADTQMQYMAEQHILFNPENMAVARILVLLPKTWQSEAVSSYYLGILIIVIACLLFSVLVAVLAARTITQPLLKLILLVSQLSRSGDLATRIHIRGVHEINQLSAAFNRMLERLESENRRKDEFVATLTHDLKVPLLAEKQTLNYLLKGTYGEIGADQQEILGAIRSTNQSTLTLVNGLLEVYRYESGRVNLVFEKVPVIDLIQETMEECRPLAAEKFLTLTLDNTLAHLPQESSVVWGDRIELKRVFQNLLSNAITNTPKHGTVGCVITHPDHLKQSVIQRFSDLEHSSLTRPVSVKNSILVSVQDSGIGFSVDDLPNLFKQFAANRGRNPMSIGLGLYNCYQVVMAHQGQIWVETTEGVGSAVNVVLTQPERLP
ncbi:MAG: HAMP domain-containing histidine kinase [Cyanobacteria bacterium]|nr:HAMP domain-containing histidine kinase [Cyanobacteriota bacterium]